MDITETRKEAFEGHRPATEVFEALQRREGHDYHLRQRRRVGSSTEVAGRPPGLAPARRVFGGCNGAAASLLEAIGTTEDAAGW